MFCTQCGQQVEEDLNFCPACGASLRVQATDATERLEPKVVGGSAGEGAQTPSLSETPDAAGVAAAAGIPDNAEVVVVPSEPNPQKKKRARIIAIACAAAAVIIIAALVAFLLLRPTTSEATVYFGSDEAVACAPSTKIIPRDASGTPLGAYSVEATPLNSESENALTSQFSTQDGFSLEQLGDIAEGSYVIVIINNETNTTYDSFVLDVQSTNKDDMPIYVQPAPEDGVNTTDPSGQDQQLTAQQKAYALFYEKCQEYLATYGDPERVDESGYSYATGLSLAKLIDFGDGCERLLLCYYDQSLDANQTKGLYAPAYIVEVWEYDESANNITCVYSGTPNYSNGGINWVELNTLETAVYVRDYLPGGGGPTGSEQLMYYGMNGENFGVCALFYHEYASNNGDVQNTYRLLEDNPSESTGAKEVSEEEYTSAQEAWTGDATRFYLSEFSNSDMADDALKTQVFMLSDTIEATWETIDALERGMATQSGNEDAADTPENLYAKKCADLVDQYGFGTAVLGDTGDAYGTYLEGLCFVRLVDFDADGTDELVVAYRNPQQEKRDAAHGTYSLYTVEVWGMDGNSITQLYEGAPFAGDGASSTLQLVHKDGKTYLVTGAADSFYYGYYYGFDDQGEFTCVKTFEGEHGEADSYSIDGSSVSMDEFGEQLGVWQSDEESWRFNYLDSQDADTILAESESVIAGLQ